jgi:hypothetical protein
MVRHRGSAATESKAWAVLESTARTRTGHERGIVGAGGMRGCRIGGTHVEEGVCAAADVRNRAAWKRNRATGSVARSRVGGVEGGTTMGGGGAARPDRRHGAESVQGAQD